MHPAIWPQQIWAENWGLGDFGGRGAGSPSNMMRPRPTCMPSFILIHPTVWPQYTNVTFRTGQTVAQGELFYKRSPNKLRIHTSSVFHKVRWWHSMWSTNYHAKFPRNVYIIFFSFLDFNLKRKGISWNDAYEIAYEIWENPILINIQHDHHHFNDHFPGETGLNSSSNVPEENVVDKYHKILRAKWPNGLPDTQSAVSKHRSKHWTKQYQRKPYQYITEISVASLSLKW